MVVNIDCKICKKPAEYGDLCKNCWLGLKLFNRDKRLLGRAVAYVTKSAKLTTKRERRRERARQAELKKLDALAVVVQERNQRNDRLAEMKRKTAAVQKAQKDRREALRANPKQVRIIKRVEPVEAPVDDIDAAFERAIS